MVGTGNDSTEDGICKDEEPCEQGKGLLGLEHATSFSEHKGRRKTISEEAPRTSNNCVVPHVEQFQHSPAKDSITALPAINLANLEVGGN